jgi:hypothetical protein
MEHPRIAKRREYLEDKLFRTEEALELDPYNEKLLARANRVEEELETLDMEAADPAAHGY